MDEQENVVPLRPRSKQSEHNQGVLDRWRSGDTLSVVPPEATWWPPRPIIRKDPGLVARVYGESR